MGASYPETFQRVLAMSSHFNINLVESGQILSGYNGKNKQKIYLDVGDNEYQEDMILTSSYIDLNKMAYGYLKEKVDIRFVLAKGGIHHENSWAQRLPEALTYLLN